MEKLITLVLLCAFLARQILSRRRAREEDEERRVAKAAEKHFERKSVA